MTDLTVGEIAKRIQEPGEDLKVVINRLRSWTRENLLKPRNDKKPGTGQKLLYSERTLVDAAIMSKLARHYGIWAPRVPGFDGALDLAWKQLPKAKPVAEQQGMDIFLIVGVMEGQERETLSKPWQVISETVWVESYIRSRSTKAGAPKKRALEISPLMGDGFFVNLTRMFERIGVPLADAAAEERFHKKFGRRMERA
jgi:hypothetical protein